MAQARGRARRRHSTELKAQGLAECAVAGASVAAVALSHGLNANLVHRWRRLAEGREVGPGLAVSQAFVALPLTPSDSAPFAPAGEGDPFPLPASRRVQPGWLELAERTKT